MGCVKKIIDLPSEAFNTGIPSYLVPPTELEKMNELQSNMKKIGYDLEGIKAQTNELVDEERQNLNEAKRILKKIHDGACILFLQWTDAHYEKNKVLEHALARLFNRLTLLARHLDNKFDLFDKTHRIVLAHAVRDEMAAEATAQAEGKKTSYDPVGVASAIEIAARARTHENAWAWVILPTFSKQHYGRILLDVVGIDGMPHKAFVLQSTFSDGEATLFHTHGQNWGFSRPLGPQGTNKHLNMLLKPNSSEKVFPLLPANRKTAGKTYYKAGEVVAIIPKTIHGISGARENVIRKNFDQISSMKEAELEEILPKTRFGEVSCLHIYRADIELANEFATHPLPIERNNPEKNFFEKNDMIVLDQYTQEIWAGGGGAWELRLLEFGPTGEHCGMCFRENDPRRTNIPNNVVLRRLVQVGEAEAILYNGIDLLEHKISKKNNQLK